MVFNPNNQEGIGGGGGSGGASFALTVTASAPTLLLPLDGPTSALLTVTDGLGATVYGPSEGISPDANGAAWNLASLPVGTYTYSLDVDGAIATGTLAVEAGVAYNSDVYTMIRVDLLRVTEDALPDAVIDRAFDRVRRELLVRFPCVGPYAEIAGDDALFFDEAASALTAVVLFPFRHAAGQAGPLTGEATPDFKYTYGADTRDERDAWTDAALVSLGHITCIRAARRVAASSVSVFQVAGRRRAIERARGAYGCGQGLLGSVLGIYEGWGL